LSVLNKEDQTDVCCYFLGPFVYWWRWGDRTCWSCRKTGRAYNKVTHAGQAYTKFVLTLKSNESKVSVLW